MASINVLQLIEEAGTIGVEIVTDQAELAAGQDVSTPQVQVGTVDGKPLYLNGVLTTTKAV